MDELGRLQSAEHHQGEKCTGAGARCEGNGSASLGGRLIGFPGGPYYVKADLRGSKVADQQLACLVGLHGLRSLYLNRTGISDAGLPGLRGLVDLKWLSLADTKVTDKGLRELGELRSLEFLDLSGNRITGDGLRYLAGLKHLEVLGLTRTSIDDQHLGELPEFPQLKQLYLGDTQISDRGFMQLGIFPRLEDDWVGKDSHYGSLGAHFGEVRKTEGRRGPTLQLGPVGRHTGVTGQLAGKPNEQTGPSLDSQAWSVDSFGGGHVRTVGLDSGEFSLAGVARISSGHFPIGRHSWARVC